MSVDHEKTKEILNWFGEIAKIPRCSKNEEQIALWLMDWAKANNFVAKMDKVRNIVIKVPGSPGYENSPTVILQGHMDMVCEKTPDSDHDFSKDAIKLVYDGEWLRADRTTLGSDNGIAIAMAMVAALDKELAHPPLELLFTVDEETGLTGATAMEKGFIDGRILLNIDSEEEGVIMVGCAGGINTYLSLPCDYQVVPAGYKPYRISAGGMKGGHSGLDIAMGRANAIKILARALRQALVENIDVRVADIKGGSAHNAIPRDSEAAVFIPANDGAKMAELVANCGKIFAEEHKSTDPELSLSLTENSGAGFDKALGSERSKKLVDFIMVIPHGVAAMSADIKDLVETSNNVANIKVEDNAVKVLTSQRSSVDSRLRAHTDRIEAVARLAEGEAHSGDGYPPWQPNMDSPLLARAKKVYEKLFAKEPVVEVIHAGLECGIIGDKYPGMDMVSIGPTLQNPHSPDERIHIGTIGKVWNFLAALLAELK